MHSRSLSLRGLAPVATAGAVAAGMVMAGLDLDWVLGKRPMPMAAVALLEWHLAPVLTTGFLALGAWFGRLDRRH
jgi:hypothetical protein